MLVEEGNSNLREDAGSPLQSRKSEPRDWLQRSGAPRRLSLLACFKQPVVRFALYAAVAAVGLQGLVSAAGTSYGPGLFKEDGPVEWLQFVLIAASGFLLIWSSRVTRSAYPSLSLLAGLLAFVAALRELDRYLDALLFAGAYKYAGACVGALALRHVWRKRAELRREAAGFTLEAPFFLLAFGFFLVVIVAQLGGQSELWKALLEPGSARIAKRVFEETIEAVGYLIIFFGAIEFSLLKTRAPLQNL